MSDDTPEVEIDEDRVASRAKLVDKEREVGSDDPKAQARAILEESDAANRRPQRRSWLVRGAPTL